MIDFSKFANHRHYDRYHITRHLVSGGITGFAKEKILFKGIAETNNEAIFIATSTNATGNKSILLLINLDEEIITPNWIKQYWEYIKQQDIEIDLILIFHHYWGIGSLEEVSKISSRKLPVIAIQMDLDLQCLDSAPSKPYDTNFLLMGKPIVALNKINESECQVEITDYLRFSIANWDWHDGGLEYIAEWRIDENNNGDAMNISQCFFPKLTSTKDKELENLSKLLYKDDSKLDFARGFISQPIAKDDKIKIRILDIRGGEYSYEYE